MRREKLILIILGIITSIFGVISIYSVWTMTLYESGTKENKLWFFIGLTSFLLMILMIPVGALLNKKFPFDKTDIRTKKVKTPFKKFDYLIAFLLIGGIIIEFAIAIGLSYSVIFIPFEKIEKITILNISFLFILQILVYIGIGMLCLGAIFYLFRKDEASKNIN
ncbi:MAG: hypothetical protein ACFFDN_15320 [Candidatus Hodarchaeota archaeon]